MSAATCPCGATLKKPGPTGLCGHCSSKRPKSPETRARMRAAAVERESDPAFRAKRVEAVRAGVARSMENPAERERRSAWGRQIGHRYGAEMAAQLGAAGSPSRMANGRKASATKLSWCPLEYRATYRELNRVQGIPSAEARRMVLDQVEADRTAFLKSGTLPQATRVAR